MRKIVLLICIIMLFTPGRVMAAETETDEGVNTSDVWDETLQMVDFESLDEFSRENLPGQLTFADLVSEIINRGDKENIMYPLCDYLVDVLTYEIRNAKDDFINIIAYTIIFSLINKFIFLKKNYIYNVSFMMMYAGILVFLMQSFELMGQVVIDTLDRLILYQTTLIPVYMGTLVILGKGFSASAFYSLVFAIVYLLQWSVKVILIPGIRLYLVFKFIDQLFEEERFSRFSELIESGVYFFMKTGLTIVTGISIITAMIAPARDRIAGNIILKSLGGAGEMILGSGMLIKNSIGEAALVVMFAMVILPFIKVFVFYVIYKFMAAVLQPVSDKRIIEGINSVGRAGKMYFVLLKDSVALFFVVIGIVCASTNIS